MFRILKNLILSRRDAKRQRIGFVIPSTQQPNTPTAQERRERWKFIFAAIATLIGVATFVCKVLGIW